MHRFFLNLLNMTTSKSTTNLPTPETATQTVKPAAKPRQAKPAGAKRTPATAGREVAAPVKAPTKAKSAPAKPAVDKAQAVKSKPVKEKKVKVVRDSYTIPQSEFAQIAEMKKRAMSLGVEVKKSELIRAGLQLICGLQDGAFKKALAGVPTLKTGRPAKD